MADDYEEQQVPSGILTGIKFSVLTQEDAEKASVIAIDAINEVIDPKLGLPNHSSECSTCGARDLKHCEGHFGVVKFPFTVLHPYYLSEVAQILNKICPGCKSIRKDLWVKGADSISKYHQPKGCKYCLGNSFDWYPSMKFKVSSNNLFRKAAILVEVNEKSSRKFRKNSFRAVLAADYWDFIPKDEQQEENCMNPNKRVLSHAQVRYLLKDVDPNFIKKFVSRADSLFLNCFPVMPNCLRVTEVTHAFSKGQRLVYDERTRAYKKLVDFRGMANELGSRILDCLNTSKLTAEKPSSKVSVYVQQQKNNDSTYKSSGLKYMKDVVLGKRNDQSFRMVVTGDPNIKLSEIGIPCHVAEKLQISEHLNNWNWEKLNACCDLRLLEKGQIYVRRKGSLVCVRSVDDLQIGDTIYRPLNDGDIVLILRPPSIHQHSLIALSVRVLPVTSVVSINPLCCSPFRGDFDGDCLHGYIPQSVDTRVELSELVALNRQLINQQSGRNLLSLSQDSLTAAHLVMEDGVVLNLFQMQQLEMFCPRQPLSPAIIKAPPLNTSFWTGKQLFSMLLPQGFDYISPSDGVHIRNGELISCSEGSAWLRDIEGNLFQSIVRHCQHKALDFLHVSQEVLCEWLSMRGLSVSLSDICLSSESDSRKNMIDEVLCGLQEAEQTCNFKQLMVDSFQDFLVESGEENQNAMAFDVERLCYEKQKSATLSQISVDAFKQVFWDIQILVYKYASTDNSLLTMFKAGSKGNLLRLVQHAMCLGLQHSLVPLSFRIPHRLTCDAWNNHKALPLTQKDEDTHERADSYIPYAVVESSFVKGLNPLECFVHSVTNRQISFSDNADLPGTLSRKLMFFMRDLYISYDGTVRNSYGNQLVQFSYDFSEETSTPSSSRHDLFSESINVCDGIGGQPVGSMSACAISEAAYSALDQPISLLQTSPLLNLKNVLECGSKRSSSKQIMTLYLSKKLGKRRHGFEYGALEIKNHLEQVLFSDIVSTVMIIFSPQTCNQTDFSPWVCHFHVSKETVKRKGLKVHSIIDSLFMRWNSAREESKNNLPNMEIACKNCSTADTKKEDNDTFCFTITIVNNSKNSAIQLESVRDMVIPFLLKTVIKGFLEIKKVDILWCNRQDLSRSHSRHSGELYLRVSMSGDSCRMKFWTVLLNYCMPIMDMIDWERSHPDNIHDFCLAFGIGAGWKYFLNNLESAISDIGKTILCQHLILVANCLSYTGEFVGLSAKGLAQQNDHAPGSSTFMRACFNNPSTNFIKAAKTEAEIDLEGSLDALAWGNFASIGTGGQFDIVYSGKDHKLAKPEDVYSLLGKLNSQQQNVKLEVPRTQKYMSDKCGPQFPYKYGGSATKGFKKLDSISKSFLRSFLTLNDIQKLSNALKCILHKNPIDTRLNEADKSTLMMALYFHPQRDKKIGIGATDIKVGCHPKYQNARCFLLERSDGTVEDFSYHKCIHGALEVIAPRKAKNYEDKWLRRDAI